MTVYFAGSIRGGRADRETYLGIIERLRAHATVLTEHIGDPALTDRGEPQSDREIHDRDLAWIRSADVLIAEVTTPSLGVGYEIARALGWGKPVLCLFRAGDRRLSAMIAGSGATVREYRTVDDLDAVFARLD